MDGLPEPWDIVETVANASVVGFKRFGLSDAFSLMSVFARNRFQEHFSAKEQDDNPIDDSCDDFLLLHDDFIIASGARWWPT